MHRCIFEHFYVIWPEATEFGEITQTTRPLRSSRSFKVTDFCTNGKPICDFLLVINSNLPPILRRFQVMADYGRIFTIDRVSLTLMPPLEVFPCEYPEKLYLARN